ncbi:hypothetical protein CL622_05865 [archaeon]|nr:hypothetical protein [archaeon]
MSEHYICTGTCHGVSETPGTCQAENCPQHGQSLESCSCTDDKHGGGQDVPAPDPESSESVV